MGWMQLVKGSQNGQPVPDRDAIGAVAQ